MAVGERCEAVIDARELASNSATNDAGFLVSRIDCCHTCPALGVCWQEGAESGSVLNERQIYYLQGRDRSLAFITRLEKRNEIVARVNEQKVQETERRARIVYQADLSQLMAGGF